MRVQDIMTKDVCSCDSGTNAAVAAAMMWTQDCGSLPVLEDGRVVGMVTDRDLFIALGTGNRNAGDLPVGEIMGREVFSCRPSDEIGSALSTMAGKRIRRLPVIREDGVLQGIISLYDIVLQAESADVTSEEVVLALQAICKAQSQRKVQSPSSRSKRAVA